MAQSAHQHSIESRNMNNESSLLPSSQIEVSRSKTTSADNREHDLPVTPKKSDELPSGMLLSCRIFIYRINTTK
jgi:hypothetical protein